MKGRAIAIMLVLATSLICQPVAAQNDELCFDRTGYCISDMFRQYWEQNGGLMVFGYPTSAVRTESVEDWSGPVQWFERDRLEDHSNQKLGVMAGRLGADLLEREGRPWQQGHETPQAGCRYFAITGYNVCGRFLEYWENNGGLERFGYPITSAQSSISEEGWYQQDREIQYFERRRMEAFPEYPRPYDVLLGLLGNEVSRHYSQCSIAVSDYFKASHTQIQRFNMGVGCPSAPDTGLIQGSYLYFEHGEMLWIPIGAGTSLVFVLFSDSEQSPKYYRSYVFNDTCCDNAEYISPEPNPSDHQFYPRNAFLRVWEQNPHIRQQTGWAIMPQEQSINLVYQGFEGDKSFVYASYPDFTRWYVNFPNGVSLEQIP
jgi:hypothetical protein